MIHMRVTSIFFLLCSIVLGTSFSVSAENVISPDIQERIRSLHSLKSISFLFEKSPSTVQATSSVVFEKDTCPQVVTYKDYTDYSLQVINTVMGLPTAYIPKNLVNIFPHIQTRKNVSICMTEISAMHLYTMSQDMKKEGLELTVVSGYRSYTSQKNLYSIYAPMMNSGVYSRVAPPGYSEHQLGTSVDVASELSGPEFAYTDESVWIKNNAHKYGFILSYEEGSEEKTGYMYEPWHLRYVGVSNATVLRKGQYALSYKPAYYKDVWINKLLGRLKDYVDNEDVKNISIGG